MCTLLLRAKRRFYAMKGVVVDPRPPQWWVGGRSPCEPLPLPRGAGRRCRERGAALPARHRPGGGGLRSTFAGKGTRRRCPPSSGGADLGSAFAGKGPGLVFWQERLRGWARKKRHISFYLNNKHLVTILKNCKIIISGIWQKSWMGLQTLYNYIYININASFKEYSHLFKISFVINIIKKFI